MPTRAPDAAGPYRLPMGDIPDDLAVLMPDGYLVALAAFAAGESDEAVAARIGVEPTAVRAAMRIAAAKLLAAVTQR